MGGSLFSTLENKKFTFIIYGRRETQEAKHRIRFAQTTLSQSPKYHGDFQNKMF